MEEMEGGGKTEFKGGCLMKFGGAPLPEAISGMTR